MNDITPPTLKNLLIPATIDVSGRRATLTVKATAEDGVGGSGIDSVSFWLDRDLVRPNGAHNLFGVPGLSGGDTFRDGTPTTAATELTLTNYTAPGTYRITEVQVLDLAGNKTVYDAQQLAALGIRTSFDVTGGVADTTAPTLKALRLPKTIDLSGGAQDVPFSAEATDNPGGSGVSMLAVYLDKNMGFTYGAADNFVIASQYGPDTFQDATPTSAAGLMQLTSATAPGSYHVRQVVLSDMAGNQSVYDAAQLAALGIDTGIEMTGTTADTTAPALTGFSLPRLIDLSTGLKSVPFSVRAADNPGGSGVDHVTVFVDRKLGLPSGAMSGFTLPDPFSSDTFKDDTPTSVDGTLVLTAATAPGAYHVTQIHVTDAAGNQALYDATQLAALGIATTFSVTDGKLPPPPVVQALSVAAGSEALLEIKSTAWSAGANTVSLSLGYDPTQVHYKGVSVAGAASASLSATTFETGHVGTLTITGTATLAEGGAATLAVAMTRVDGGAVSYTLHDLTVGGASQALDAASVGKAWLGANGADRVQVDGTLTAIDGAGGIDTAAFSGKAAGYTVTRTTTGFDVKSAAGVNVHLAHVERLSFADGARALDTDGIGGQVYRLYQAAFDRKPDATGIGYWMDRAEHGATADAMAQAFIGSQEFATKYGANPDDTAFVTALYQNVLHRAPDQGGAAFWLKTLETAERSAVLVEFAESAENVAQVASVIGNGFTYTPWA